MLPMMISPETVTVVEPVIVEDRGTSLPDWSQDPASSTEVTGCSVQPGSSSEDLNGRLNVDVQWTVWMPPGTSIGPHSGVIVRGTRYSVNGQPKSWNVASMGLDHIVVELVDWHG